jgi:hypothetical protein
MQFPFFNPKLSEKRGKINEPQSQRFQSSKITGSFNHCLLGIWDLYIEKPSVKWRIPFYSRNGDMGLFISDLQYLWKAVYDLSSSLLFARLAVSAALALSPAVSLWCAFKFTVIVDAKSEARFTGNFLRLVSVISLR